MKAKLIIGFVCGLFALSAYAQTEFLPADLEGSFLHNRIKTTSVIPDTCADDVFHVKAAGYWKINTSSIGYLALGGVAEYDRSDSWYDTLGYKRTCEKLGLSLRVADYLGLAGDYNFASTTNFGWMWDQKTSANYEEQADESLILRQQVRKDRGFFLDQNFIFFQDEPHSVFFHHGISANLVYKPFGLDSARFRGQFGDDYMEPEIQADDTTILFYRVRLEERIVPIRMFSNRAYLSPYIAGEFGNLGNNFIHGNFTRIEAGLVFASKEKIGDIFKIAYHHNFCEQYKGGGVFISVNLLPLAHLIHPW